MYGKLISYISISAVMLSLGWYSWSTPFFLLAGFVPLWIALYEVEHSSSKHKYLITWGISFLTFLMWNIMTTYWLKNAA